MNKYGYGRSNNYFFTILTPLNENVSSIFARLHYNTYVGVTYKDAIRLCVSCDKGPEICEGEKLRATELTTGERKEFMVKHIFNNGSGIWVVEFDSEVFNNQ